MNEMTLGEWLDNWYILYAKPFLKTSTLVSYNGYIEKHIKPFIGAVKLSDLNGIILQEFFNEKYVSGRLDHTGGLSEKTVLNIRQMLHAALRKALENGFVSANYVEHVRLQKVSIPDMRVLSVDEQQRLITALENHQDKYSIGFILLLSTGIRVGELCALKWSNIDFLRKKIKIRYTLQRLPNLNPDDKRKTIIVINSPKSERSIRDVFINDLILDKLNAHRDYIKDKYGKECVTENQFILTRKLNKPVEPRTVQDAFKRLLKRANVEDANLHSLRHTFATRAIEAGIDYKTLSLILGHADISTTMNRYAHVMDDTKRAAMEIILSQLFL